MARSKWESVKDKLVLVEAWARDGLIDKEIAAKLDISEDTFYTYAKKYPEFSESLKRGKEVVDVEVENALFKNATGYDYTETVVVNQKIVTYRDGKRVKESTKPITVEVTKHHAAETTAQIFWLKNRKPLAWRDKHEVEHSGELNNPFAGLTTEELKKLISDG